MTNTMTLTQPLTGTARPTTKPVTTRNIIHGEWIKFWSVRSTSLTIVIAALATVMFGMIFSAVAGDSGADVGPAQGLSNPVEVALGGMPIIEIAIGVLGVMFVAGEYSTGLIRTWFAAAGRRGRVIQAKASVLIASVLVIGGAGVTAAVVAGQAVYGGNEETVPLADALDVVVGTSAWLVGVALIGLAAGFMLRSNAGAIGALVGGVFIGPNLLSLLPDSVTDVFFKYLPSTAGDAMMSPVSNPELLSRGTAYVVFAAWVVGLLTLASVLVNRRDA